MHKTFKALALGTLLIGSLSSNVEARTRGGIMGIFNEPYFEIGYSYLLNETDLNHLEFSSDALATDYKKRSLDDGHAGYVEMGFKFSKHVTAGINLLVSPNSKLDVKRTAGSKTYTYKGKVSNMAATVDFKYHFSEFYGFAPNLSLGLGASSNRVKSENVNDGSTDYTRPKKSSTQFAYNLGAGIRYMMSESAYISLSYKYMDFGKIKGAKKYTTGGTDTNTTESLRGTMRSHLIMLGVGVQF